MTGVVARIILGEADEFLWGRRLIGLAATDLLTLMAKENGSLLRLCFSEKVSSALCELSGRVIALPSLALWLPVANKAYDIWQQPGFRLRCFLEWEVVPLLCEALPGLGEFEWKIISETPTIAANAMRWKTIASVVMAVYYAVVVVCRKLFPPQHQAAAGGPGRYALMTKSYEQVLVSLLCIEGLAQVVYDRGWTSSITPLRVLPLARTALMLTRLAGNWIFAT